MDAASSQATRENRFSDLDSLDNESLKALVLAKQTEIENLKLLVLKLKRMHFGPRSEKLNVDIEQLELRLEDLEANQAAAGSLSTPPASVVISEQASRKPARRSLPAELPRETETIAPKQEACPDCGGIVEHEGGCSVCRVCGYSECA